MLDLSRLGLPKTVSLKDRDGVEHQLSVSNATVSTGALDLVSANLAVLVPDGQHSSALQLSLMHVNEKSRWHLEYLRGHDRRLWRVAGDCEVGQGFTWNYMAGLMREHVEELYKHIEQWPAGSPDAEVRKLQLRGVYAQEGGALAAHLRQTVGVDILMARGKDDGEEARRLLTAMDDTYAALTEAEATLVNELGELFDTLREGCSVEGAAVLSTLPLLCQTAAKHRERGQTIGWTNGNFDLLHPGHFGYLREAKKLVDVLFVGINSDEQVRIQKGEGRPVFNSEDRVLQMKSLRYADYVHVFNTPTVHDILRELKPDMYIKGGDYKPEETNEWDLVQEMGLDLRVLAPRPGMGTTELLSRETV